MVGLPCPCDEVGVGVPAGVAVGVVGFLGVTGAVVTGVTGVGVGTRVGACVGLFSDGLTVSTEVVASTVGTCVGVTTGRGSERC